MPDIKFLAFDNCMVSGITGPVEILSIANSLAGPDADRGGLFTGLESVSADGRPVVGFAGIPVQVSRLLSECVPDVLVIPPCFGDIGPLLADSGLRRSLVALADSGTVIATVCAGSFLLAGAGLLDNRPATTHWKLAEDFRLRFPAVDLQPRRMLIDGGGYICAGGAMAWQDLALHLVARFMGREVASNCAKVLVMDSTRHVQTPYFMFDQLDSVPGFADRSITAVQKWMQDNYRQGAAVEQLADLAGLGVRTFLRRFKRATGMTPNSYLQQLRIEAARHLLEVSSESVDEITELVGYENVSSFRRLFKSRTGLSPREYRSRFSRVE
ncbi:GlxA family transcriptional regulator [Maridesulfovibrio sp. FT414]|uniref:GlxA family transcriptional regulator n=1 Tax=Maridesulfovibrio sp. FT414 TaxID=2979469 RepID=UPI003D803715